MKHIIVTGTSRGIGLELAKKLAEAGHQVMALSRNDIPTKQLSLTNLSSISFDLSNETDYERLQTFLKDNWSKVDALINNAGILLNKPFMDTNMKDFEMVFKTNLIGPASLIKTVLPFMGKDSHVVNISSMGGVQGSLKFPGLSAYSSSKGALITLTELLAEEYKNSGPSFNALALGAVQTEMLQEAFPGYQAPVSATEMAEYIMNFTLHGHKFYNGKLLQVSNSTP